MLYEVWRMFSPPSYKPWALEFRGTLDECRKKLEELEEEYPGIYYVIVPEGSVVEDSDGRLRFTEPAVYPSTFGKFEAIIVAPPDAGLEYIWEKVQEFDETYTPDRPDIVIIDSLKDLHILVPGTAEGLIDYGPHTIILIDCHPSDVFDVGYILGWRNYADENTQPPTVYVISGWYDGLVNL